MENKKITKVDLLSKMGGKCSIEYRPGMKISSNERKINYQILANSQIEFKTIKGQSYQVRFL